MDQITPGGGGSSGEQPSEAANLIIKRTPYPGSWLLRLAAMVSRMNPANWFHRDLCPRSFRACGQPLALRLALAFWLAPILPVALTLPAGSRLAW